MTAAELTVGFGKKGGSDSLVNSLGIKMYISGGVGTMSTGILVLSTIPVDNRVATYIYDGYVLY